MPYFNKTTSILGITTWRLLTHHCAQAPAADVDRKAAAINGTDRQTDGRTLDSYIEPAARTVGAA